MQQAGEYLDAVVDYQRPDLELEEIIDIDYGNFHVVRKIIAKPNEIPIKFSSCPLKTVIVPPFKVYR